MIRAKKSLGQHFLHDPQIAQRIAASFLREVTSGVMLEVGPGQGALTRFLIHETQVKYFAVEADERMIDFLQKQFPSYATQFMPGDFLEFDFASLKEGAVSVIGNFPYNISTQILFKILENRHRVPFLTGMFQLEVARRIASPHGNKDYGILSVLLQAFYDVKFLFRVNEGSFSPPPKVKSAVVALYRKTNPLQLENESFFRALVKTAFNQRRKTLRNSLSRMVHYWADEKLSSLRAEQVSVSEWIKLSNQLWNEKTSNEFGGNE